MLVLGSCLGIRHKMPLLLSHLVLNHQCNLGSALVRMLSNLIAFFLSII